MSSIYTHSFIYHHLSSIRYQNPADCPRSGPLCTPVNLRLAVGAKVVLLMNLNVKRGLTNGALGQVHSCSRKSVTVKFGNKNHCIRRIPYRNPKGFRYFSQIPLRLAYGLTSYKVQGQTLKGHVRVDGKHMSRSEVIVSMSRACVRNQLRWRRINTELFRMTGPCETILSIRSHGALRPLDVSTKGDGEYRVVVFDSGFHHYMKPWMAWTST